MVQHIRSKPTAKDIDNARHGRRVPLHSDRAIHIVVPVAAARYVEATVCFLHDDAVGDILEVLIDIGHGLQNLSVSRSLTSSQMRLDQTCASLTL